MIAHGDVLCGHIEACVLNCHLITAFTTRSRCYYLKTLGYSILKFAIVPTIANLCSDGGVHSRYDQVIATARGAFANGAKRIRFHVLTDGRDVPGERKRKRGGREGREGGRNGRTDGRRERVSHPPYHSFLSQCQCRLPHTDLHPIVNAPLSLSPLPQLLPPRPPSYYPPPDGSSLQFVRQLEKDLADLRAEGCDARIASGGGRMCVSMDRYEVRAEAGRMACACPWSDAR